MRIFGQQRQNAILQRSTKPPLAVTLGSSSYSEARELAMNSKEFKLIHLINYIFPVIYIDINI